MSTCYHNGGWAKLQKKRDSNNILTFLFQRKREKQNKKDVISVAYWRARLQNKNKYRVSNSATGGAAIKFLSKLPTEIYHLKIHLFIRRFHI